MKPDKDKDITERMAAVLRKHSLPYKEGAWERFKDFEAAKRKKVVLWPYFTGAAAAMVLFVITLFMNNVGDNGVKTISKSYIPKNEVLSTENQPLEEIRNETLITQSTITPLESLDKRKLIANNGFSSNNQPQDKNILDDENNQVNNLLATTSEGVSIKVVSSAESKLVDSKEEETNALTLPSQVQSFSAKKAVDSNTPNPAKINDRTTLYPDKDIFGKQDFAYNESLETDKLVSVDKWNFSLEVSPNIMDNNVNFGGGVGVAYNLSKKLSISSGVSYVQLSAHRNPNKPAEIAKTSLSSYNYSKSLNEVNTSLTGLDIPVNLKFNINNKMYASAGISVFNVLNESRYNNFEERVADIAYSPVESSSNPKAPEPLVHTVYSQEASDDAPYQGKNFTGFFNFSVGYKLPFLEKLNLAIEPYLKIPVGSLSEQDMDLSNGGLKIITNF